MNQEFRSTTANILAARLMEYGSGIRATRYTFQLSGKWALMLDQLSSQLIELSIGAEAYAKSVENEILDQDPEEIMP